LSGIILSIAQGISILGCFAAPVIMLDQLARVDELTNRMSDADKNSLRLVIVIAGFASFCLCAALAIVFQQARLLGVLLRHPESQRLLAEVSRQPLSAKQLRQRRLGWGAMLGGAAGAVGGRIVDSWTQVSPLFILLGGLCGLVLVPLVVQLVSTQADRQDDEL
jgi:hypothetical protein